MIKKCEKCGKTFEARQENFKLCPECFTLVSQQRSARFTDLLLNSYYDLKDNLLKEVFIGIPAELANIFAKSKPPLKAKQLRDFHLQVLKARNKAILKGIESARPLLYECQRNIVYQLKRGVIPESFASFLDHHLVLAQKDEKMIEGFFKHLDSIVCYFPKEKKGE